MTRPPAGVQTPVGVSRLTWQLGNSLCASSVAAVARKSFCRREGPVLLTLGSGPCTESWRSFGWNACCETTRIFFWTAVNLIFLCIYLYVVPQTSIYIYITSIIHSSPVWVWRSKFGYVPRRHPMIWMFCMGLACLDVQLLSLAYFWVRGKTVAAKEFSL